MDRIDAMKVFVTAVDEGSLAGAARRLKRSPTAVSRALSFLEAHLGVELLHRTTRTLKLSEAGERYAAACRRVLTDLNEADMLASGERSSPRGVLTISAPPVNGEEMLRPITDAFLERYPDVSVTILLLDRLVNLVDEGVDIAIRIGHLPDSSLVTTRLGGDVRRVVVGSPAYLAKHPPSKKREIWRSTTLSRSVTLVSMLGVSSRRKARPFPEPSSSHQGAPSTACAPPWRRPYPVAV
jgi:DNA-binding transcriptional LysR family regulator